MGVVTEEAQEYMVPTVPHGGVEKNENEYVCMSPGQECGISL